jgi:hypothetical protein
MRGKAVFIGRGRADVFMEFMMIKAGRGEDRGVWMGGGLMEIGAAQAKPD